MPSTNDDMAHSLMIEKSKLREFRILRKYNNYLIAGRNGILLAGGVFLIVFYLLFDRKERQWPERIFVLSLMFEPLFNKYFPVINLITRLILFNIIVIDVLVISFTRGAIFAIGLFLYYLPPFFNDYLNEKIDVLVKRLKDAAQTKESTTNEE